MPDILIIGAHGRGFPPSLMSATATISPWSLQSEPATAPVARLVIYIGAAISNDDLAEFARAAAAPPEVAPVVARALPPRPARQPKPTSRPWPAMLRAFRG